MASDSPGPAGTIRHAISHGVKTQRDAHPLDVSVGHSVTGKRAILGEKLAAAGISINRGAGGVQHA
jgi:hypothetical protein